MFSCVSFVVCVSTFCGSIWLVRASMCVVLFVCSCRAGGLAINLLLKCKGTSITIGNCQPPACRYMEAESHGRTSIADLDDGTYL